MHHAHWGRGESTTPLHSLPTQHCTTHTADSTHNPESTGRGGGDYKHTLSKVRNFDPELVEWVRTEMFKHTTQTVWKGCEQGRHCRR